MFETSCKKIISDDNQLIAIIVPHDYDQPGVNFITDEESSLQLAYINCSLNYRVDRHEHPRYKRIVMDTMECIIIKKGKIKIDFYDNIRKYICNYIVQGGDTVFLVSGGHSIEYLEPTKLIEIRQGPYNKTNDKVEF